MLNLIYYIKAMACPIIINLGLIALLTPQVSELSDFGHQV